MEIEKAVEILKKGGVIIYPTETLYGIGGVALFESTVNKVFEVKKRALDKPLPVIIGEIGQLFMLIKNQENIPIDFIEKNLWPGPVSILFSAKEGLPKGIVSPDGFVCVRLTSNNTARELCIRSGYPLVATSANISSKPSPQHLEDIDKELIKMCDLLIKSGEKPKGGKPSTILKFIDKKKVKVLRYGAFSLEKLKELGLTVENIK